MSKQLPREIISLVHNVELNKVRWWDKAIQRLVVATVWLAGKPLSLHEIIDYCSAHLSLQLEPSRVQNHISELCSTGILLSSRHATGEDAYQISDSHKIDFENEIQTNEQLETRVRQEFIAKINNCDLGLDSQQVWQSFNNDFLIPFVREMGARTLSLLSQDGIALEESGTLMRFLSCYPENTWDQLQKAILDFLDPSSPDIGSFILQYLNAFFLLEAGSLRDEELAEVERVMGKAPSLTLYLDTNFLFSALDLRDSKYEAAQYLMKLIEQIPNVSAEFWALPITVEEAQGVLVNVAKSIKNVRNSQGLYRAALGGGRGLDDLARKYLRVAGQSGVSITVADYFRPYTHDLLSTLESKGILADEATDISAYLESDAVSKDIRLVERYEEWNNPRQAHYRKNQAAIEHDVVLWHVVNDKRSPLPKPPLDTRCWIVTLDHRFIGFDSHKRRRGKSHRPPICVHPASLIQMLQLWLPRSTNFEELVLGTLRPIFTRSFDPEAEEVTWNILQHLSRYENLDDLSDEAIQATLVNDILRQRLRTEDEPEKQFELVHEALLEQDREIRGELSKKTEQLQKLSTNLSREQQTREELETRVRELEQEKTAEQILQQTQKQRGLFAGAAIAVLMLINYFGAFAWLQLHILSWRQAILYYAILIFLWASIFDWRGAKLESIATWSVYVQLHRFNVFFRGILVAIFIAVIANGISSAII